MTRTFVSSRELSKQPGRVLRRLKKEGPQVVTQNGRPAGYLIPASQMGIEADLESIRRIMFGQAVDAFRQTAAVTGAAKLTPAEIDAEIAAVRAERRTRK